MPTKFTINSTTNWGLCLQAALACSPTLSDPAAKPQASGMAGWVQAWLDGPEGGMDRRTDKWTDRQKIFPFYRTLSPIGATAQKKIENRGCSYYVALDKFFPTVIWFLILKFFLTKLLPTKVKRSECPKSNNHLTVVYLGKAVTF